MATNVDIKMEIKNIFFGSIKKNYTQKIICDIFNISSRTYNRIIQLLNYRISSKKHLYMKIPGI